MKHKFLFLAVLLSTLFTTSLWAQTPAGYAIFGDKPYGYEDLTDKVEVSTTISGGGDGITATDYSSPTSIVYTGKGLGGAYVCHQNIAVALRFKENTAMTLTDKMAIHLIIKRTDENTAGGLELSLCKSHWGGDGRRLSFEIANTSVTSELSEVVLNYSSYSTKNTYSTYGQGDLLGGQTFPGGNGYELFRICATNGEAFEITQIYIDADATSPDPVAPVAGDEDAPTGLTLAASNIVDKSVTLTASATDENSPISYTFYYKASGDADFTAVPGAVSAASGADAVKVVTGLAPETTYSFKVVATDPSSNSSDYSISDITTDALYEVRYYFFRGNPSTVNLPSEGITSHDLRRGQTPGTNIAANRVSLEEKKYHTHFQYVNDSWFSFDQSLKSTQDLSEITQVDWYLVVKFRTTFSNNSFNIRLNNAGECWQVSQSGEKGQLPIDQTGNWNTLTLPLSTAMKTLNFTSSMSGNVLQFHSNGTSSGMYLDIAYAYLTNLASSVDDLADNVAPVISSLSDGDKTTSSVVLTVNASDDSGEDITYIVKEGTTVLTSTPATGVSGAATAITVSELEGQDHTLTVIARDGAGNEVSQNIVVTLPAALAPPSNLVVTTTNTDKSVTFTMSADDDNASLVYAILDGSDNVLVDNIAGTAGVETVYTLHGLTPETAYSFKVRVTNAASLSTTSDAINITTDALSEHRFYLTRGNNTDPLPESSSLTSTYVDCNVEFGNAARDNRASDYISAKTNNTWIAITFKPKATVANEIDDNWYIVVRFRSNLSNNVFGFNNFRLNLDNNAQNWYINNSDSDKPFGRDYNDGDWIVLKKKIGDRRAGSAVPASYLQAGQIAAQLHVNANLIAGEFLDVDYVYFTDDITSIDEGTQHNAKIMLKDNADNSDVLAARDGQTLDVDITRSLTNVCYNTFCVPFDLSAEQVEAIFGAGTTIGKLGNAHMKDGDELYLGFEFVDAIEAGVPYIIQPANEVANPLIAGVTINKEPNNTVVDGVITFKGVISPELINEQSAEDHSILLLAANNTLSWPNATANIKGMRAYFETTSTVAHVARRARFGFESEQTATGIDQISNDPYGVSRSEESQITNKVVIDGQLIIIRDGVKYNAMGVKIQ